MNILSISRTDWRGFFRQLYERSFGADIFDRSAQVAFYFAFSLFPMIYFVISIFGLVLNSADELRLEMFVYLSRIMPVQVYELVHQTVESIIESSSKTKLVIGLSVALWSASAGVDGLRSALNSIYGVKESRNWLVTKAMALGLTLAAIILVAGVLAIVFYGWHIFQTALNSVGLEVTSPLVLGGIQWISILLIMLFACELIYNLLPDLKARRWAWINAGSIIAIILWLLLSSGFRLYLSYFNGYNRTYGSLGAVMIMMLWLYLTAFVVMLGGIINVSLLSTRKDIEWPPAK